MADISKIQLPSGNIYNIKDAVARQAIAGGIKFIIALDEDTLDSYKPDPLPSTVLAGIPEGITIYAEGDGGTVVSMGTGTLAAGDAETLAFYLVYGAIKPNVSPVAPDQYYEFVPVADEEAEGGKRWEMIGSTQIDLSALGALAYKNSVSLNKGSGDNVLGEATTFTAAASAVSFSGGTTDTFVKGVSAETGNKLVTTSVPNVTSAGAASTWGFGLGSGADAETLIISGANGTAPTLGSAITAATGEVSASGTGSAVVTDVTIGASATAVTSIGTATAAAQTITVGSNDKVKVAQFNDLSVSTS